MEDYTDCWLLHSRDFCYTLPAACNFPEWNNFTSPTYASTFSRWRWSGHRTSAIFPGPEFVHILFLIAILHFSQSCSASIVVQSNSSMYNSTHAQIIRELSKLTVEVNLEKMVFKKFHRFEGAHRARFGREFARFSFTPRMNKVDKRFSDGDEMEMWDNLTNMHQTTYCLWWCTIFANDANEENVTIGVGPNTQSGCHC